MKRPCIRVKNLSYTYEKASRPALEGLSFTIHAGEYTAILGANGSGKSTLLSCINGLCTPPAGSVLVYDRRGNALDPADAAGVEAVRRVVGTVLQNPDNQIVGTVVEEDTAFGPENLALDREEIRARVAEALRITGLEKLRDRPPQFLSGGERQRLSLAGVLAMNSEVIALDEAASMIDPLGREALFALLDRLAGEGKTILHITHSLNEALRCDRCLVLRRGVLVFDGRPEDLIRRDELEAWGFSLSESIKTLRCLSAALPDFSVSSLDPAEFAEALRRLHAAGALPRAGKGSAEDVPPPAAPLHPPAVVFEDVSHEYLRGTAFRTPGIEGISCCIPHGSSVVLLGASGSGKSTVLKHINALLLPHRGRVRVLDEDTRDTRNSLRSFRFCSALAIQHPESALFETYVADDVAYGPRNRGMRGPGLQECVRRAMEETGLPFGEFADRETGTLSGGEKRRAAIAGVLAMDSEILLLDEPAAGLDGRGREAMLALMEGLKQSGKTLIATSHALEQAVSFDLAAVMAGGRLVALGPPREIFGKRWDPAWNMGLPWTVRVARALAERGVISPDLVPLNAAELAAALGLALPGRSGEPAPAVVFAAGKARPAPSKDGRKRRPRRKTGLEFFRNITIGQFLDRPSPLRRLGAGKKMGLLLLCGIAAAALKHPLLVLAVLALTLLAGKFAGKVGPLHLLRFSVPLMPYVALLVFFQAVFSWPSDHSPVLYSLGPLALTADELFRSVLLVCRVLALVALITLYSAVTPLRETLGAIRAGLAPLSRIGFPAGDAAMAVGIALRFIPVLTEEAERIVAAQLSRGADYGRARIKAALSMVVPLLLRALERSETLAKAMALRLYRGGN
jgi:energy-coupling factor transport system ATP-binding protein